jgi:peptide deformylase
MILPLIFYDDPGLRKKSQSIEEISHEIRSFAHDMVESMIHYNGVGLAAPQVGKLLRIIVIRDELVGEDGSFLFGPPEILINPILSNPSSEIERMAEGCLSIPGIHAEVMRPNRIRIRYQTLDNRIIEEEAVGFRARVVMHENDHLNGVLYIDRVVPEERVKIDPLLKALKDKKNQ